MLKKHEKGCITSGPDVYVYIAISSFASTVRFNE